MTPFFPDPGSVELQRLSLELIKASSKLGGTLNQNTRVAMAELVSPMNSYYSNLIEGHFTNPIEIENALNNKYSTNPAKRVLQLEAKAHVRVNKLLQAKLSETPVMTADFIRWLHDEFYRDLPKELKIIKTIEGKTLELIPGEFRSTEVSVGMHIAPAARIVSQCLDLFADNYDLGTIRDPFKRIIAIAASHHKLAWIHPFLDGNGRIVRLFSEACLINEGLHADGMWSISRGLAVNKDAYYAALSNADEQRLNDFDGRGNLSEARLREFCIFFLETAIDQVQFMTSLFDTDGLVGRVHRYVDLMVSRKLLRDESRYVIIEALLLGKVARGDMERLTGRSEITARAIMNDLIEAGVLKPESDKIRSALRINFPVNVAPYFFPKLFPKDVEATILSEGER